MPKGFDIDGVHLVHGADLRTPLLHVTNVFIADENKLKPHRKSKMRPSIRNGTYCLGRCVLTFAQYFKSLRSSESGRANIRANALANPISR
jgi:hypothetical protein